MSANLVYDVFSIHHTLVTPHERLLLLYLADIADEDNGFFLSPEKIIKITLRTSLSDKEINATLKSLKRKKLIKYVKEQEEQEDGEYYELIF